MFKNNEDHRTYLISKLINRTTNQYNKGAKNHGGRLWRKNVLPHAIEESIDMCVYLATLEDQVQQAIEILKRGQLAYQEGEIPSPYYEIEEAINVLKYGNKEGIEEEELEK